MTYSYFTPLRHACVNPHLKVVAFSPLQKCNLDGKQQGGVALPLPGSRCRQGSIPRRPNREEESNGNRPETGTASPPLCPQVLAGRKAIDGSGLVVVSWLSSSSYAAQSRSARSPSPCAEYDP